jgi:hypothetical protein
MNINRLTIGIQSFDKTANINQKRIACNINTLEECIVELKKNNVYVNIDLVALFDYDNDIEKGWINFKNDLRILDEIIKPHSFYIQVNYATEDHFYEYLYEMRCIVKEFLKNSSGAYSPWDEKMISTNKIDVLRNLDHVHYFVTEEQRKFSVENGTYRDNFDDINYIGFGGTQNHQVFTTLTNNSIIYGYYDFYDKRWIHNISTNMVEDSDYIPEKFTSIQDVQCGPWTLKASETALSWLNEKA